MVKKIKNYKCFSLKTLNYPHQHKAPYWASLTFDPGRVTLVGLLPLLAARARKRGATAAFIGRNTLPSIQAGLSAHSYSRDKRHNNKKC